jgi:glycosyltransferase involved in cell wall biosynthesis
MNIAALVESPNHVCCRYRIRAFEDALLRAGCTLTVEGLEPMIGLRVLQFFRLRRYDAVLLQRKMLRTWQLKLLRRFSARLIFDFDDAMLYRDSYDPRGVICSSRAKRFAETVRRADVLIAGNDYLAECALKAGADPQSVKVIPTCIPTDSYSPADHASSRDGIDLVWIGSSSTLKGLEQQRELWEFLGREIPGLRLRVISDRFPAFASLPVVPVPWSEKTEASELRAADAGVNWMPDDPWSLGKCGLKILQYQAAGLPVIANPVGIHKRFIEPGVSGFLAQTPGEWLEAIRTLASNPSLRERMGKVSRERVEAGYSLSAWSSKFVSTVLGEK